MYLLQGHVWIISSKHFGLSYFYFWQLISDHLLTTWSFCVSPSKFIGHPLCSGFCGANPAWQQRTAPLFSHLMGEKCWGAQHRWGQTPDLLVEVTSPEWSVRGQTAGWLESRDLPGKSPAEKWPGVESSNLDSWSGSFPPGMAGCVDSECSRLRVIPPYSLLAQ